MITKQTICFYATTWSKKVLHKDLGLHLFMYLLWPVHTCYHPIRMDQYEDAHRQYCEMNMYTNQFTICLLLYTNSVWCKKLLKAANTGSWNYWTKECSRKIPFQYFNCFMLTFCLHSKLFNKNLLDSINMPYSHYWFSSVIFHQNIALPSHL